MAGQQDVQNRYVIKEFVNGQLIDLTPALDDQPQAEKRLLTFVRENLVDQQESAPMRLFGVLLVRGD